MYGDITLHGAGMVPNRGISRFYKPMWLYNKTVKLMYRIKQKSTSFHDNIKLYIFLLSLEIMYRLIVTIFSSIQWTWYGTAIDQNVSLRQMKEYVNIGSRRVLLGERNNPLSVSQCSIVISKQSECRMRFCITFAGCNQVGLYLVFILMKSCSLILMGTKRRMHEI